LAMTVISIAMVIRRNIKLKKDKELKAMLLE